MTTLIPKYTKVTTANRTIAEKFSETISVLDYGADPTGVADSTTAIQAAITASNKVYFPTGTYKVTATINLHQYSYLYGDGADATVINSTASGFTFELLNSLGTVEINAPKFFDLTIQTTDSGIKLNSQTDPFLDGPTSQNFMMRPVIERCILSGNFTGTGIQWSKCFDGTIHDSKIISFSYGIDFKGCDLNEIANNRVLQCVTSLIRIASINTFGSQTLIRHNDLLLRDDNASNFIESSDRNLIVKDNYLEGGGVATAIPAAINITGGFYVTIDSNRVECQSTQCTNWLVVSANLTNIWVANNVNNGNGWGEALFNGGAGTLYFYNSSYRQKIFHQNNSSESGFPFNSLSDDSIIVPANKYIWTLTPANLGLLSGGNGETIKVINNEFSIPPTAGLTYWKPTNNVAGNVDILIVGYASVASQTLDVVWGNGNLSPNIGSVTLTLTTSPAVYTAFSNIAPTDLFVILNNIDTTHNGNVLIQQIIVQYH